MIDIREFHNELSDFFVNCMHAVLVGVDRVKESSYDISKIW